MNITFALELNNSKHSDEEQTVYIRLTQNRKLKRVSTGVRILSRYWNKDKQIIKPSHPLSTEYNKIITEKLKQIAGIYAGLLETHEEITPDDVIRELQRDTSTNFFDFAYNTKLAEIRSRNKLGTYRRYDAVLKKLEAYTGKNVTIRRINYQFIKEYSLYLKNQLKNTDDTVSANLSVIRSIINEAIRHGKYPERNPFDQIQLRYTDNTKEKLTAEELKRLFITDLPPIPSLLLARDFFLACFLAEGTRAGDMMLMQPDNIINGCLVFKQQKTGTKMVIPVMSELTDIFNRYQGKGRFIFPLLNDTEIINEVVINSRITYINKYLKELAKYCGIFKNLTTHVSRHTFTDLALQATNENIYLVQKSLGHSSVRTTEIYSKNRVNFNRPSPISVILGNVFKLPDI